MDFLSRGSQTNQPAAAQPHHVEGTAHHHAGGKRPRGTALLRFTSILLLFSATILVVALLISLVLGGPKNESKYVDTSKLQAVFLNGGQVYFGNIAALNDKYMNLQNIYYLRVNQQVQPNQKTTTSNNVSLVKLGCELHGPQDAMVINRDQVVFWENLKSDGQVAKAVAAYVKQNPNGQQCTTTSNSSSNSTPSTTTGQ